MHTDTPNQDNRNPFSVAIAEPPLRLRLFGAFALRVRGQEITGLSRAAQELLALLALSANAPIARDTLAQTLWPDAERERGLFYLRRSLTELRATLGEEKGRLLTPTRQTLGFDFLGMDCDVITFDRRAGDTNETCDKAFLEQATACYRGPLLESCGAAWVLSERVARSERYGQMLTLLADLHTGSGDLSGAARLLYRAVASDPLSEAAARRLMRTLAQLGEYAGAEKQYRRLRQQLRDDLNMEPSQETATLYRDLRLRAQSAPGWGQEAHPVPVRSVEAPTVSGEAQSAPAAAEEAAPALIRQFPCPLTSLIGRTRDLEAVSAALQSARLVTLVGPGGVGKTRLAIAAAEAVASAYPDGVAFADLAPAASAESLLHTIAASLGARQNGDALPQDALCHFLHRKFLLLILDNAEHVLTPCAYTAEMLLRACPHLRILCTSREPLRVHGEHAWQVSPLESPPEPHGAEQDEAERNALLAYDAVALLVERASAASPSFRFTARNAAALAQICRRLDGLPLALELAAARFRSLSPREIASRLQVCFRLLGSGDAALPRHRTLLAVIEWSYSLLNEAEQRLLRQLSIFVGGWTVEAVEAVCPASSEAVLPLLLSLVEKSLVVYDAQEEQGRYRLLEMTRQYAAMCLVAEERDTQAARHAAYFLGVAQDVMTGGPASPTLTGNARTEPELDNLRAARDWWQERDGAALWLEYYVYFRGIGAPPDWRERITRLVAIPLPAAPLSLLITYLAGCWAMWTGHPAGEILLLRVVDMAFECGEAKWQMLGQMLLFELAEEQGNNIQALAYAESAALNARAHGELYFIVQAETHVCKMLARTGAMPEAACRLQIMLDKGRRNNDWRILLPALNLMGEIAFMRREWDRARAYWEECLPLTRKYHLNGLPNQLRSLASVAREKQDYKTAWALLEQGITASRRNRALDREGWTRWDMADIAFRQGDTPLALEHLRLGLGVFQDNEEARSATQCLRQAATFHKSEGRNEQAAALLGHVERVTREQALAMSGREQSAYNDVARAARAALGEEAWQDAVSRGAALTTSEAESLAFS